MNYVVLGAGPAGVTAAETLRSVDKTASITLVGGEPEPPYSRMAIPYYIYGKVGEDGTYLRQDPAHYDKLNIKYVTGEATKLDPASKTLTLKGRRQGQLRQASHCNRCVPDHSATSRSNSARCSHVLDATGLARPF